MDYGQEGYELGTFIRVSSYGRYENENYGAHTMRVSVGDMDVYFSYSTVVAFRDNEHGVVKCKNIWSLTTGKHLRLIPGGWTYSEVPRHEFSEMFIRSLLKNVRPPRDVLRRALYDKGVEALLGDENEYEDNGETA